MGHKESNVAVSSSPLREVLVVPHICEGVFIAKGKDKEDSVLTLVPGKALHGDELISVWNEDETEIEYRVWSPLRSKLAAAIVCSVSKIWAKPGSRVLYLGDVCGNTVSQSDLFGSDDLVYVVGLSDVVNMAEYRSNVVPIFEKSYYYWKDRMVVGMVDVIIANMVHPHEVSDTADIALNAGVYLRFLVSLLQSLTTLSINQRSHSGSNNNNDMTSQPKQLNLKALRSAKELYNIRSSEEHHEQEY